LPSKLVFLLTYSTVDEPAWAVNAKKVARRISGLHIAMRSINNWVVHFCQYPPFRVKAILPNNDTIGKEKIKIMRQFLGILFFVLANILTAQVPAKVIRGRAIQVVQDRQALPLEGVTVLLLGAKDSMLRKTMITDKNGVAEFEEIAAGNYLLSISGTGYKKAYSDQFTVTDKTVTMTPVTLEPAINSLGNVTVESRKPFIERKIDRLIVNVEGSIVSAGSSAFEALERSPGIVIDQNDNISFKGRAGVIIMVDGKPSPLSGADLTTMLRGAPANSIEKIELIANPSSRFDASGNAGIINIVMKKDKRVGSNGNINVGMGQGIFNRTNAGLNMNYRNNHLNVFGSYNHTYRTGLNDLTIDRSFISNGQKTSGLQLFNHMLNLVPSHNTRAGADFFVSKKTIIGILVNGLLTDQDRSVENRTAVTDKNGIPLSYLTSNSKTPDKLKHFGVNLNLKHTIDSLGQEISMDMDYATFNKTSQPSFVTNYFDLNNNSSKPVYLLDGNMLGDLAIRSFKADYTRPCLKGGKLEAGLKSSIVTADNDLKFYDRSTGTAILDAGRTNHFIYEENINAGYLSLHREFGKLSVQLGMRAEQANIKARQQLTNEGIDTSYVRLFPSAFFTYKLHADHQVGFSFSRRILRPGYSQLNPFNYYIDLTSYATGNPYLRPEFTNSFEFSYTLKQQTTLTVSYARTIDNIIWIIKPLTTSQGDVSVETSDNLGSSDYYGLNVSDQRSVTSWWTSSLNADIYVNRNNGVVENTKAINSSLTFQCNSSQQFSLPKKWSIEMNLSYEGPQQTPFAYSRSSGNLTAGVQKQVVQGRGTLRFSVSDIFKSQYPRVTSSFLSYRQYFSAVRDTRIATLSLTYRFGKNTVTSSRRRTTGVEEEKSRAQ
jgi:iron complex outermembrane receptor protein